ncbi:MAG: rhamnan synthesis F family protein, partial [Eubacteriales bacterium]
MILEGKHAKRCGVYAFYDKDGHADGYVVEFLKGLREVTDHLLVVVNGEIDEESRARLRANSDDVMIRPNEGYDITAYKKGLFRYGYEKLLEYDEAFICNDTLFGPIHPFSEMFDAMAGRDLDFWGITAFHEV